MIRPIPDLPAYVLGFEALGEVTAEDYREVLEPALQVAQEGGDRKLRLMVVFGPEFDGYRSDGLLEDARVGLRTWSAWERIAVVTDRAAMADAIRLMGWLLPGEVRVFPIDRVGEATIWLTES